MKQTIILIAMWLTGIAMMMAVPANPRPRTFPLTDGTTVTLHLVGDEYGHAWMTDDGRTATIDSLGIAHIDGNDGVARLRIMRRSNLLNRTPIRRQPSTTGSPRGLIILVNFSDKAFTNTREAISRQMNEEDYSDNGATGSARDYFTSQSMGQFTPQFDVVGPVTLDFPYRYYGHNGSNGSEENATMMIFSAILKASQQGLVNLADYDSDGDSIVDMAFVIYAGKGEADGGDENTVWPFMTNLQGNMMFRYQKIDGMSIGTVACAPEQRGSGDYSGIGTFCHEYSHCLGLDDHYDVDYSGGYGMGVFDVMSQGNYLNNGRTPVGYSAFERFWLGWLELSYLDSNRHVTLHPLDTSNEACAITTNSYKEFFVLENRQQQGWDAYLPCRGLMITHIDYDEEAWMNNTINDDPDHQRIMLMAADNNWSYSTMSGDMYPGLLDNTSFTDTSTPNSKLWDGSALGKPVTNITLDGENVTFDFAIDPTGIERVMGEEGRRVKSQTLYNLAGQRVDDNYHGIVVIKGKKVKR